MATIATSFGAIKKITKTTDSGTVTNFANVNVDPGDGTNTNTLIEADPANSESEPQTTEELYAALSDKNRAIEILKRRLDNQQIQLGYYLHKNLATEAVLEFSTKCFPHFAEDSTQLSLAMYKFIRDTGGKTRLAQLREKLTDYNNRVHKALLKQEQLVRQGLVADKTKGEQDQFKFVYTDSSDQEKGDDLRFAKNAFNTAKLEMCSQLLSVTLQVRKELERFRICAENVVRLEEERNALVDRVFTLPPERIANLRVSVVDNENRQNIETSAPSMTSVSTSMSADVLREIGNKPSKNLGGALHDMESEAIELLLLSEKQKNEFVIALEEARVENQQLQERLRDLEDAASDERVVLLQEKCNRIEREVLIMRKDLEAEQYEKEQIIRRMMVEISNRDAVEKNLNTQMSQMRSTIEMLRNERNALQKKLDEEMMKSITAVVRQNVKTEDICVMTNETNEKINVLTNFVVRKEGNMKDVLSIVSGITSGETKSDLGSSESMNEKSSILSKKVRHRHRFHSQKVLFDIKPQKISAVSLKIQPGEDVNEDEENITIQQAEDYNIYYDSSSELSVHPPNIKDIETDDPEVDTAEADDYTEAEDTEVDDVEVIDEEVDEAEIVDAEGDAEADDQETDKLDTNNQETDDIDAIPSGASQKTNPGESRQHSELRNHQRLFIEGNSLPRILERTEKYHQGLTTTSLRVQSCDKDGKSESMHAVLECTSQVDGLLEVNNASKLHLRLQCTSPQRNKNYCQTSYVTSTQHSRGGNSCYVSDKHTSGDRRPSATTYDNRHLSPEAKLYLSKQLKNIKSQLQTSKSTSSVRREIINSLNEIYYQLFESEDFDESLKS